MINVVGVVGAGTMGLGIAQVCAVSGYTTLLFDVQPTQLERALHTIDKNLSAAIEKGKMSQQQKLESLSRINIKTNLSDLKADLIIEAAIEKLEIKQPLFAELEKINDGKAILASNTSSISITQIGEALKNPANCLGLHFFNPADRMKLVEIVSTQSTNPAVTTAITDFSVRIGKIPVHAKDSPGFIVNRVARHFYGESLLLLEEKEASFQAIDVLLKSAGFKMGPFELMDLIGVETNLMVTKSVYEGFKRNPKFKPNQIQQKLVDEGYYGRKTGRGFYDYEKNK